MPCGSLGGNANGHDHVTGKVTSYIRDSLGRKRWSTGDAEGVRGPKTYAVAIKSSHRPFVDGGLAVQVRLLGKKRGRSCVPFSSPYTMTDNCHNLRCLGICPWMGSLGRVGTPVRRPDKLVITPFPSAAVRTASLSVRTTVKIRN